MNKARYALVSKCRMQIGAFVDDFKAGSPEFDYIVDLIDHSQADKVQEGWFYDPVTGIFSQEGKIPYPGTELTLLTFEQMQALETANNIDYLVSLKDLGL